MTKVRELVEKVVAEFRARGYEPYFINYLMSKNVHGDLIGVQFHVHETYRMNNVTKEGIENVTVTIEVFDWEYEKGWHRPTGKRLARIKVPEGASDKVISRRVEKAISYIK